MGKIEIVEQISVSESHEMSDCMCRSVPVLFASGGDMGNSQGYASVKCTSCELKVEIGTSNFGYGENLKSLKLRALGKWNNAMKPFNELLELVKD